mmetsp:Transcript_16436/g.27872  ORF Transcript_16436/g.27872 Transcript_16436/m.27872 type:complete len:184 (-) Transcript_16436:319-870(-)
MRVGGEEEAVHQQRLAQTRTVIIENLSLDLGLTPEDIIKFLKEQLVRVGERGELEIVAADMNPFNNKVNNNCISVQVSDIFMVARLKRLDGSLCLGEKLRVRKFGEETISSNAQASAIAIQALLGLQGGKGRLAAKKQEDEKGGEAITDQAYALCNASLKTLTPSCVIKISNAFDRDAEMTVD